MEEVSDYMGNATYKVTVAPEVGATFVDHILPIIYAFIGVLGMFGNGLVCVTFRIKRRTFGSVTNLLILNQSMIDLIDSFLFLILRFGPQFSERGDGVVTELACRLWYSEYIMWSLFIASTINLLFVSLERYFAICHAVKHRSLFTTRRANIARLLAWIVGFSYQSYWAALHKVTVPFGECYAVWPSPAAQAVGGTVFFCCEYLIPLSIMTFSYANIVITLRSRSKRENANVNTFQRAKRNVTFTLCFVFVSYAVCWTPTEFAYLMYNMGNDYDFGSSVHFTFTVLVLLNMCINPLIYLFKYKRFQGELRKLFCRCFRSNQVFGGTVITVAPAVSTAGVAGISKGPWGL